MYEKRKEKTRFMRRLGISLLLAFVLTCLLSCGQGETVVLETQSEDGGGNGDAQTAGLEERTSAEDAVLEGKRPDAGLGDGRPEAYGSENIQSGNASQETSAEETIQVHVCGAVCAPGVYELSAKSRVFEAVDAAGGMSEGAAADYLNLADGLFDGAKVRVPFLSELAEGERSGPLGEFGVTGRSGSESSDAEKDADADSAAGGLVDLNHADRETLMTLPGIGEAKAEAVIAWREEHGDFEQPADIMLVPGIKEAAYEKLKDKVTVR